MRNTEKPMVNVVISNGRIFSSSEIEAALPAQSRAQGKKRKRTNRVRKRSLYGVDLLTRVRLRQRVTLGPFSFSVRGRRFSYLGDDRSEIVFQIAKGLAEAGFPHEQISEIVQDTVFWRDRESEGKVEDIDKLLDKVYEWLPEEDDRNVSVESDSQAEEPENHYALSDDPANWAGEAIPEREWIIKDLIPKGKVTALYGAGGTGKTLLLLQLAVACATGRTFIGESAASGRVFALLAENEKWTHICL